MSLVDKITALRNLPDETDLLVALGVEPDRFALTADGVEIGGESIPFAVAREALRRPGPPARTVVIGDLPT